LCFNNCCRRSRENFALSFAVAALPIFVVLVLLGVLRLPAWQVLPVTVLAAVTHLPDATLGAMIGRQLPIVALLVPFYVIAILGGRRSLAALWPMLLVAGGSMAVTQFLVSNFADYRLADALSSLASSSSCFCGAGIPRPIRSSRCARICAWTPATRPP
jgi:L-lactate permease